jgi:hypothetical protein
MQRKERTMARLEHIRTRLENWAKWRARREGMGIGYPRQAAFLRVAVDGGRGRADTSASDADAQEIDLAVDAMKLDPAKSKLAKALELVYLGAHGGGVEQAARTMGKAVSTRARLPGAGRSRDRAMAAGSHRGTRAQARSCLVETIKKLPGINTVWRLLLHFIQPAIGVSTHRYRRNPGIARCLGVFFE